jgi:hypothetical protein
MKILALVLLTASFCAAQELPDTPQPSTTCVDHGKPCPEWLHKLIGQYPPTPYAPLPPRTEPAKFLTFRTFNQPVLRTNKQVMKSPVFMISQTVLMLTIIPHGKSRWHVEPIEASGLCAFDYMSDRLFSESFSIGPPLYAAIAWLRK